MRASNITQRPPFSIMETPRPNPAALARTLLAHAVKGQLMRSDLKAGMGQFHRPDLRFRLDQDIENLPAGLANKMLMALGQRVETLRGALYQYLELMVRHEFLQVAIDGPETDAGETV